MCGRDELPWKVVKAAARALIFAGFPAEAGGRAWMNVLSISGATETAHRKLNKRLTNLLAATLHTDATDPRDKIYSLLSLLEEELSIPVDYGMPVETLYRDTARLLINKDRKLLILYLNGATRKLGTLPSWVPDWSVLRNFGASIVSLEDVDPYELRGKDHI